MSNRLRTPRFFASSASFPFEPCHFEPGDQCDYTIEVTRARNLRHKRLAELRSVANCVDFSPAFISCKLTSLSGVEMTRFKGEGRREIIQRHLIITIKEHPALILNNQ